MDDQIVEVERRRATPKQEVAPEAEAKEETPVEDSPTKPDQLKKIEGIGPKISEILVNAGITSFAKLAASTPEEIRKILEGAGPRYQMHNPKTWPQQAALAAEGKWDELKSLQDNLNGGR